MKSFLNYFFAGFFALVVFFAIVVFGAKSYLEDKPEIKSHSFLVVDIYGEILEYPPPSGMMGGLIGGSPETLHRILTNLEKASVDDRIDGVIMKISASNTAGRAKLEEMRHAIRRVRESGKPVYAFGDYLDRDAIYLASACDSIFAPPSAYINFIGMATVAEHVKKTLDKLGINPNIHKIKEYKSAAEIVTREDMSPEAKEMRKWMLNEFWDIELAAISRDRDIPLERLEELMEQALFLADEARDAGLIDRLMYWNELGEKLKGEDDEELRTVCQCDYEKVEPAKLGLKGKKKIAVVHAQGMIGGRTNRIDPIFGVMMGHESVSDDLKAAGKDDDVVAVVFRIDSGGGEGLASDLMCHEVEVLSRKKPVVVSMVDVAASGGYYIAYKGSKLVADPMTITGSIGSISGKFNMTGFYDKLGITHDYVTKGPMAMIYSDLRDFTPEEWEIFKKNHWDGFNMWLADVAKQRGMTFEEAEKLALGRVWSGRQAVDNGLVDELGGLHRAIELAKELAELPSDEKVTLVHYPKPAGGLLSSLLGGGLKASVHWAAYQYLHREMFATLNDLSIGPVYMMDDAIVE